MMREWHNMTAADLGRAIGRGEIDPVALTESYLAAIKAHPAGSHIYARLTAARALSEAAAAGARAMARQRLSPLDGVPVSWKDLFDTAGVATEAGSRLLAGRIPVRDADVLRNATSAGLVCLGKTHMTELAFSGLGLNPMTATPPNANDAALAPGGSSSGAAVSVALGLAAAAVGSDTGGSVRIPAAWNDLVGLKTTHGRLPMGGTVPLVESFDSIGPLSRTVEDAALMLAAIEGRNAPDLGGSSLRDKRLVVLQTVAFDGCREGPLLGFEGAIRNLRDAGARVENLAVPELAEAMGLTGVLFTTEAYGIWRKTIEAAPDKMYAPIRDRFRLGGEFSGSDFVAAWRRLREIRRIWADAVAGFDAVLLPTAATMPPDLARLETDAAYFAQENLLALRNTRIGNLMGLPALTLPTGVRSTGIMFLGAAMGEENLVRLGHAAEKVIRR